MLQLKFSIEGDLSTEALLERFGLQDHGPVQMAIDEAVIRYSLPYWAWDTGALANSAYSATDIGSGEVVYDMPYASEMYYGIRENGEPVNYKTDHNPLAGAYPIERMKADHMQDIVEEARAVVRNQ